MVNSIDLLGTARGLVDSFSIQEWRAPRAVTSPWVLGVAIALAVALAWLVLMAWRRRDLTRVDRVLDAAGREDLHQAIRAAERQTVGEIVPVVLGRSDPHPAGDLACALVFALAGYLLAWSLPLALGPAGLLGAAVAAGAGGWLLARSLPDLRRVFLPPTRLRAVAEEQAAQEFHRLGLRETEARTGVLLFVSLFERFVVVIGDAGIDKVMREGAWIEIEEGLAQGARGGELAAAMATAIQQLGTSLAEHFPWQDGERNELPDRVEVRPE